MRVRPLPHRGALLLVLCSAPRLAAQHFHRLPATPQTVAWGYYSVHKDLHLTWPRAETPMHFITMGMDKDLTMATQIAVQNAIDLLAEARGWSKMEVYRLVSVACDVRVTELVDGNVGVHVMIPKSIVGKLAH